MDGWVVCFTATVHVLRWLSMGGLDSYYDDEHDEDEEDDDG